MPRKAKPPKPSEELQPALFSPSDLPSLPQLVEATKRYIHSGKITCKDEERAAAIAVAFLETRNITATARRFSISPNTVKGVMAVLEDAGKLDDLKQRLSQKLGLLAEVSAEAATDAIIAGKCPPNVLPIMMGVAIDKKALLDGDPTQRIEQVPAAPVGAADVLAYLASKGVQAPAIDVKSTVTTAEPQQTEAKA